MATVIWYPCLPNWFDNCVCKPGQKTDCGVVLKKQKPSK